MPEPMVASVLCASLLDGPSQPLQVVHRSRAAYQLADRHGKVRLCLATATAVRLPYSVTVRRLPDGSEGGAIGDGRLAWGGHTYRVARWWTPARPDHPTLRRRVRCGPVDNLVRTWRHRLGRGVGLTPYDDDVTCGALVTLHAARDPRATGLSREVLCTPLEQATTATSAALLRAAAGGWCIDAVAAYLASLAAEKPASAETAALLDVGASSGHGLLEGMTRVCGAAPTAAAA
jgi:Protein of unknown function (DUF2877)